MSEGLQSQISSKNADKSYLQEDMNSLLDQQDICLSNIQQLEQELIELLLSKKNLSHEYNHLKILIEGDYSPMGRIQFVQSGVLEGTALQSIQERIMERRQKLKITITKVNEGIMELKTKSIEIEEDIEQEKKRLLSIDRLMTNNKQRIDELNSEIATIEGDMRSLT